MRPEVWNPSLDGADHAQAQPTADHQRLDASTPMCAQFAASGDTGTDLAKYDWVDAVTRLQGVLDPPPFAAINADLAVRQGRRQRTSPWFSLLRGPSDRRQLAKQTGREFDYLVLYGKRSESSRRSAYPAPRMPAMSRSNQQERARTEQRQCSCLWDGRTRGGKEVLELIVLARQ